MASSRTSTSRMTNELKTKQFGEVQKVGFLRKKGHVRRNWLDRWFVLTTEGLYYYKNRTDPKPIGVIPLFSANANEDTLQKHQFVFTVCTAEGKDYPIQASTRDEMLMWIKAIDDAKNVQTTEQDKLKVTQNPACRSSKVSATSEPHQQLAAPTRKRSDSASDDDDDD